MEPKYKELEETLNRKITQLKRSLRDIDKDDTKSHDIIEEHTEQIKKVLQRISNETMDIQQFSSYPIHELLDLEPLTRAEIPLEVIEMLMSAGFDVDAYDGGLKTCLYIAIDNHHYNIVRLLIGRGAKCDEADGPDIDESIHFLGFPFDRYTLEVLRSGDHRLPVTLLASQENAPLDLFDLLATQQSLNVCDRGYDSPRINLPLHVAVMNGHTKIAKHLIKLGASVNELDDSKYLPLWFFMDRYYCTFLQFDNALFMSLLPPKPRGIDILRIIWKLLDPKTGKPDETKQKMLHQLIQRLHFVEPLQVMITFEPPPSGIGKVDLVVNGETISECTLALRPSYLSCLMLVKLNFNVILIDCNIVPGSPTEKRLLSRVRYEEITEETQKTYIRLIQELHETNSQKYNVKSLERLCILQIRDAMNTLDDDSFLSLPVPPLLHRLLTYRDVVTIIIDQWNNLPT